MKELIVPPLIINIFTFIIGIVMGLNPGLVVASTPGGFVFQLNTGIILFTVISIPILLAFTGFMVLGSGLGGTSVSIIVRCVISFVTWAILSTVTYSFLILIPTFGILIYGALTICYAIGVFLSIGDIVTSEGGGIEKEVGLSG